MPVAFLFKNIIDEKWQRIDEENDRFELEFTVLSGDRSTNSAALPLSQNNLSVVSRKLK